MVDKHNTVDIVRENTTQTLGALGSGGGILVAASDVVLIQSFYSQKLSLIAMIDGLTANEANGALVLLLADSALTLAEVEEAFEQSGPVHQGEVPQKEVATRFVRILGEFRSDGIIDTRVSLIVTYQSIMWLFTEDNGEWNFVVYNQSSANLTTGSTIRIRAAHQGRWQRG